MSDNVIILGAGFSHDAGIPLLGGFVERMWEYAARKKSNGDPLSKEDLEIFEDAIKVKNELDSYHGRAVFDDRNIEDILSILSFNVLGGGTRDKHKLNKMNRAIARTIELSCSVTHPGVSTTGQHQAINTGPDNYRNFWKRLFQWVRKGNKIPTIITFNYDLVLERSLLQVLIGTHFNGYEKRLPFESIEINYFHDRIPNFLYKVDYVNFNDTDFKTVGGTILTPMLLNKPGNNHLNIELLKLHGSLNFPNPRAKSEGLAESLDDPHILPPIFNKKSSKDSDDIWKIALQRLQKAKNVVIVGYSLPRTDIYMQYFLKAALGPNMDLNKISVFDPVLYSSEPGNKEIRSRYEECFAPQLHNRINFNMDGNPIGKPESFGTAEQFVNALDRCPERIFF